MDKYLFRDQYFGISKAGLHLLRNGFNYKTIKMTEITIIRIRRGRSIKNWLLLLLMGICIVGLGYYLGRGIWFFWVNPEAGGSIYIEQIVSVIVGTFLGGYCIILSLKIEEVIEFQTAHQTERFATKHLKKAGKFTDLKSFLKEQKVLIEDQNPT